MRRSLTVVLGCVLAVVLAGCGAVAHMTITPSSPAFTQDITTGKSLFHTSCSACHTLANDGATGTIGPDLDAAFGPDRCQGFSQSTIQDVVYGQINYADDDTEADWPPVPMKIDGTVVQPALVPGMPPNIVRGQQARDVASYVAAVAGITQAETGGKAPYWSCTAGAEVSSSSSS